MVAEIKKLNDRCKYRKYDQRDFNPVEEKSQQEYDTHQREQNAPGPETRALNKFDDNIVSAE